MSALETHGRQRGSYYNATDLLATHFPEPRWAVTGLIPEGLTLLGGAPKLGKSWLCLGLGLAIASGQPALGAIPVDEGDVLYCALEDPPRRLKSRLRMVLGAENSAPERLAFVTELPGLVAGVDLIAEWLEEHPDARLVIVDVLAKIRPPSNGQTSAYEADYKILSQLKQLADRYRIAVVVVTHLRKMHADDPFDQISGTTGQTGAADTTLVAKRTRGENAASLHVTGRDVLESEYAVTFDPERCTWTLDGDALADAAAKARTMHASDGLGDKAAEIVDLLAKHSDGLGPTAVGGYIGLPANAAGVYLQRLAEAGRIEKVARGRYSAVESVASVESDTGNVLDFQRLQHIQQPFGDDGDGA